MLPGLTTTWKIIFGVLLIVADYSVYKGGAPTLKELVTPSKKLKQEYVVYDKMVRVGEWFIPKSDTIYFVNEKNNRK
jgi:hypothetical protein